VSRRGARGTREVEDDLADLYEPEADSARRRRPRVWPWVLLFVLLALIAALVGVAIGVKHIADRAFLVRDELTAARTVVATIPGLAQARDTAGLEAAAAELTTHADAALAATDDPIWTLVEQVPVFGENLSAVRKTTAAVHILVDDALPPAIQLLGVIDINKLGLKDGRIDLSAYQAALPMIPALRDAVGAAQTEVADINRDNLVPQVDDAIGEIVGVLDQAAPVLNEAERVLPVALRVLGQNEPRNYLLMFQNNAETRATGGIPASLALLRIENGAISLPRLSSSTELENDGWNLDPGMPPEALGLYESDTIRSMQNYTRTPNFPTSAGLMSRLWQKEIGGTIDGVISLDPVALKLLLEATGPVGLADGTQLDSGNAVRVMLEEVYDRYGPQESDAFFADAVSRIFATVVSGTGTPLALLEAIDNGVDQKHVMVWLAREDEQAMSVEQGASGTFVPDNAELAQVGVFLNDSGYGKLDYYLSSSVNVTSDTCATGDGPATITTSITLKSDVPASGLSDYALNIRGPRFGVPRDTIVMDVLFFGPVGGQIVGSQPENGDWRSLVRTGVEQNRPAKTIAIGIPRGESRTVTFTSTVDRASLGTPSSPVDVRTTPMLGETPITIDQKPCA
jgi:hypothetical protein